MGHRELAAEISELAEKQASEQGNILALIDALRVRALVLSRLGQTQEALARIEKALSLSRSLPFPFAEARLHRQCGEILAATGEMDRADEHFRQALKIFDELGARKDMEVTARLAAGRRE